MAAIAGMAMVFLSSAPANAYIDDPMINGKKFATTAICVGSTLNQTTYPVGAAAQQYNLKIGTDVIGLTYKTDCAAAGYTPSKRMVVGTFSNANEGCLYFTNQQTAVYNGYFRWTNGPGVYLNTAIPSCVTYRVHWISEGIGYLLGLINFNSSGWNSHVMNETLYSQQNVPYVTASEGQKLREVYLGVFCDSGTVC